MNFLERRKLGITIRSISAAAKDIQERGEEVTAAGVLAEITKDKATDDLAGIDWDSVLEFIERLLPLILKIISLFT